MMALKSSPTQKVLELGGGANPMIQPDGVNTICVDVRAVDDKGNRLPVNFTADFNEPLPIGDEGFDCVLNRYVIEHLSWRKVRQFVSELFRILKPSGKVWIITANTEAQFEWVKNRGYEKQSQKDRKAGEFEDCSCILFGDQDYPENTHRNYLSPGLITDLLSSVGFENIIIQPVGVLGTDMHVEAIKPIEEKVKEESPQATFITAKPETLSLSTEQGEWVKKAEDTPPQEKFSRKYFEGGHLFWGGYGHGGYFDYPCHEVTARQIITRKPESVLELGCARGYVLKKLQDLGIQGTGVEVSKHCLLTRVTDPVVEYDLTKASWPFGDKEFDLVYSIGFLDHIPEKHILTVLTEMSRVAKRGLHGIGFDPISAGDKTRCLAKSRGWWNSFDFRIPTEGFPKDDLERGDFPQEVLAGDGRVKLNLGCGGVQFHYGWMNFDLLDLRGFSEGFRYNFRQWDVRQGIPSSTGIVDLIFSSHLLDYLTYDESLKLLRECRRVIRPDGAMRIIVPDASLLFGLYGDNYESTTIQSRGINSFSDFDHYSERCEKSRTKITKLHSLIYSGGQSIYDKEILCELLNDSGWKFTPTGFRCIGTFGEKFHSGLLQIERETLYHQSRFSLVVDCLPLVV